MKFIISLCVAICITFFSLKAQLPTNTYYAVAHNNGNANVLFKLDGLSNQWVEVGATGTNNIRAIATDPVNNLIYAVDRGNFGTINPQTGLFNLVGTIGSANGDFGPVNLNDITGLTFNFVDMILYATHRVFSGDICNPIANSHDLLFKIDITNGKVLPNAMLDSSNNPNGYAVIDIIRSDDYYCGNEPALIYDVDDIAYDPYNGLLYAIQSQQAVGGMSIINSHNGSVESYFYDFYRNDIEGLGFGELGKLFATGGYSQMGNNGGNMFTYINFEGVFIEYLRHKIMVT